MDLLLGITALIGFAFFVGVAIGYGVGYRDSRRLLKKG